MIGSVIRFFRPVISRLQLLYWYITQPATTGVKVIIIKDGSMLLVEHTYYKGLTFPGGGIKRNEKPIEAAFREVKEELGIELHDLREFGRLTSTAQYKLDTIYCFEASMPQEELHPRKMEIARYEWRTMNVLQGTIPIVSEILKLHAQAKLGT